MASVDFIGGKAGQIQEAAQRKRVLHIHVVVIQHGFDIERGDKGVLPPGEGGHPAQSQGLFINVRTQRLQVVTPQQAGVRSPERENIIVQPAVRDGSLNAAAVIDIFRHTGIADGNLHVTVFPVKSHTHFTPIAELTACSQTELSGLNAVLRQDLALIVVGVDVAHEVGGIGHGKITEGIVQRLVKFGIDARVLADSHFAAPFSRQTVQGRLGKLRRQGVTAGSLEVVLQAKAEPEIIRPPCLIERFDDNRRGLVFFPNVEVHAFKGIDAVNPVDIFLQVGHA
ncbi:MAG: hypothetical protein BWX45_01232 [Deltaproteobacteria bacterium ADurb.Bin002]|nr:MAG: hypothetical protein BWX45_01232 [Deltaproteobacteria bacterium ADurb.Bin002]